MSLRVEISRSVRQADLQDWNDVCDPAGDWLMHPGLLEAAEASMGVGTAGAQASECETLFWYLLAYRDDRPVGAACVTEYPLDATVFASPFNQRVVGMVRRVFPSYLKFRVTFCGLPISTAGSNLRVVDDGESANVVLALNDAIEQIARERKTWLIVYKELDPPEAQLLRPLEAAGFVRGDSLPMNRIINKYAGFAAMLAAMRSHYRYKIAKSRKKFADAGLELQRTTGRAAIEQLYTPSLHAMYECVTRRAEHRLEILPREFFLELAARFPDELILTTITQGGRVLAFAWSLCHAATYRNLFVGINYERSEDTDAYFNLMVEDIAYAMEQPVEQILVGQTADDFKSRLGCLGDPRYLFIKVTSGWLQWCFLKMQSSILTPPPPAPQRDVFKKMPSCVEPVA
jgi:Peptidogalycan biosysnthesis/recognition